MALTTNKKNKIINQWKAGKFKNYSQVAKFHKIDYKTVKKLLDGIPQSNARAVAIIVEAEVLKKSMKSPQELNAVEQEVIEKLNTQELDNELVAQNRKILKGLQSNIVGAMVTPTGRIKKLDPSEIKALSGAVKDIEVIANPKDSGTVINNNNVIIPTMEDLYKKKG